MIVKITIQNLTPSILGHRPGKPCTPTHELIPSCQGLHNELWQLDWPYDGATLHPECWKIKIRLRGGWWTWAWAAGIEDGIWFHVGTIESALWGISLVEEGFQWSQWAIGDMESWKSVLIWALSWVCDRPHHRHVIQRPDIPLRYFNDCHGMCKAYSNQFCDDWNSLCEECGKDHQDLLLVVWGCRQDLSSAEQLTPSMCLHFSGKWIISTFAFITDIVHLALTKITCSHAAMQYSCITSVDSIYGFRTQWPMGIRRMAAWLLANDRFTCCTNVHKVSSNFPSCLIIVLPINLGMEESICSDWNNGFASPDKLLWHTTNGNER